jgi:DNA-binding transcriptional LysR family regulator
MSAFEAALGVRLFERLPTGYVLTATGEELAAAAREMDATVAAVERRVIGRDRALSGTIRVATADTLALSILPGALASFRALHPEVDIELTTSTAMVSLSKRDADLAVRPTDQPPETLVGRRIADIAFAPYASPAYLGRTPARRDLARHTWIAPDDSLAGTVVARWMRAHVEGARVALRADTYTCLREAAVAGVGVAALPCYLGDVHPGLTRVRGVLTGLRTQLWILVHEDLRATARIRALSEHLSAALGAERDLIEGRRQAGNRSSAGQRPLAVP